MPKPLFITTHARQKMMLRRISMDDVLLVISDYETMDRDRYGTVRFFRGDICIVVKDEPRKYVVMTVLYRFGNLWTDEDVRNRR